MAAEPSGENGSFSSEEDLAIDVAAKKVNAYINQDSPKLIKRATYMPYHGYSEEGTDAGHILGVGFVKAILTHSPGRPLSKENKKELATALNRKNNLREVSKKRNRVVDERRDARLAEALINDRYISESSSLKDAIRKYVVALENSALGVPSMPMIADRLAAIKVRQPGRPDTTVGQVYAEREAAKKAKRRARAEAGGASSPSSRSSKREAATPPPARPSSSFSSSSSSPPSSKLTAARSTPSPTTVYSGVGRPRTSDYVSPGAINYRASGSSSSSHRSTPSPTTVYSGVGRPRTSDYVSPGVIHYGSSGSSSSRTPSSPSSTTTPSRAARATPSPLTVYSGVGRPRTSDYVSPGVINYGSSGSSSSRTSFSPSYSSSGPLKKDGTPDMRYAANRR